jgi:chloramphenicol-sensitive protein RarD
MKQKYYLAVLSAFLIWGFMPLIVRALQTYSVSLFLYTRILISITILALLGFTILKTKWQTTLRHFLAQPKAEKQKVMGLTLLSGFLLVVNWGLFVYVVNYIDTQSGAFAYALCPILTALLGYAILSEKLANYQWAAIFLCVVSCGLMAGGVIRNFLYSLLVGFLYALYLVLQRFLKDYDKIVLLSIQLGVAAVCVLPFYGYVESPQNLITDYYFWGLITIVSAIFTVLPLFLNLYALKALPSATVGIFMYLNPITGFTLAFFYFNEQPKPIQIIAYSIILFAIIVYNFPKLKEVLLRK